MKKIISSILSVTMIIMILCISTVCAGAEDAVIKVNNKEAKPGDIITYSVSFEGLDKRVAAINANVQYDQKVLSLISGDMENSAIEFGSGVENPVYNEALENQLLFNSASAIRGLDFSKDKLIVKVHFLVNETDEEKTQIKFEIEELYDIDNGTPKEGTDYNISENMQINVYDGEMQLVDKTKPSINAEEDSSVSVHTNENEDFADTSTILIMVIIAIFAVVITAVLIFAKKREKAEEKEE